MPILYFAYKDTLTIQGNEFYGRNASEVKMACVMCASELYYEYDLNDQDAEKGICYTIHIRIFFLGGGVKEKVVIKNCLKDI